MGDKLALFVLRTMRDSNGLVAVYYSFAPLHKYDNAMGRSIEFNYGGTLKCYSNVHTVTSHPNFIIFT